MEKNYGEKLIFSYEGKTKNTKNLADLEKMALSDYRDFELSLLAEKIKLKTYCPKPKMLFY